MSNFITAVIHEGSFDKLASFIDGAKNDANAEIFAGGVAGVLGRGRVWQAEHC